MIIPTVGRVVWVWPGKQTGSHVVLEREQPWSGQVVFVHNEREVNVVGHDHVGHPFAVQRIRLRQDDDEAPEDIYAEWMPYQKGQAAKTEQLEKQAAAGS